MATKKHIILIPWKKHESKRDQDTYKVIRAENTTAFDIGSTMTRYDISTLPAHITYTIKAPRE